MKKYFFPSLLCSCLLAYLNPVAAQTKKQTKDSSVVIIFQESSSPSTSGKHKKGSSENNVIKVAPLGFLSGTFPLLYERRISDFFTIQAGGGLTNKNYVRALWLKASDEFSDSKYSWNNGSYSDEADELYNFNSRTAQMGYMYTIEPRIYFESEAPEGSFLGLAYNYTRYNFQIPTLSKTGSYEYEHNGSPVKEYENITDYLVHFGGQQLFDRISLEYSTAVGLRKISGSKYVAYDDGIKLKDGLNTYNDKKITFAIGFKVGYHF